MSGLPGFEPPTDHPLADPFWEATARGVLVLPRCSVCGSWQWYPEVSGTDCTGGALVWDEVPTTGTVYTFTRVHRSFLPGAGRDSTPYVVGSVELDGVDGPKLIATFADVPDLAIGARVGARFVATPGHVHPVFEPISPDDGRATEEDRAAP